MQSMMKYQGAFLAVLTAIAIFWTGYQTASFVIEARMTDRTLAIGLEGAQKNIQQIAGWIQQQEKAE